MKVEVKTMLDLCLIHEALIMYIDILDGAKNLKENKENGTEKGVCTKLLKRAKEIHLEAMDIGQRRDFDPVFYFEVDNTAVFKKCLESYKKDHLKERPGSSAKVQCIINTLNK